MSVGGIGPSHRAGGPEEVRGESVEALSPAQALQKLAGDVQSFFTSGDGDPLIFGVPNTLPGPSMMTGNEATDLLNQLHVDKSDFQAYYKTAMSGANAQEKTFLTEMAHFFDPSLVSGAPPNAGKAPPMFPPGASSNDLSQAVAYGPAWYSGIIYQGPAKSFSISDFKSAGEDQKSGAGWLYHIAYDTSNPNSLLSLALNCGLCPGLKTYIEGKAIDQLKNVIDYPPANSDDYLASLQNLTSLLGDVSGDQELQNMATFFKLITPGTYSVEAIHMLAIGVSYELYYQADKSSSNPIGLSDPAMTGITNGATSLTYAAKDGDGKDPIFNNFWGLKNYPAGAPSGTFGGFAAMMAAVMTQVSGGGNTLLSDLDALVTGLNSLTPPPKDIFSSPPANDDSQFYNLLGAFFQNLGNDF